MLFIQFLSSSPKNLVHYIALSICLSSTFFSFFKNFFQQPDERREWDSNPRALADKRFSRPPRYDHFDISPYAVVCVRCVLTADASDILALKYSPVNNFFTFFSFFISSFCFSLQNPHKYGICRDPVFFEKPVILSKNLLADTLMFQKCFRNVQIFRCGDLNVLIRTFCQSNLYSCLLLYHHSIICDLTHIFPMNTVMCPTDQ